MIFAKIKGTKKHPPEHRLLFSDIDEDEEFNFYRIPALSEKTKYDPDKTLDSHEWFYVKLDEAQRAAMIQPYLDSQITSADLNKAIESDFSVIEVIYRVFGSKIIFTKITDSFRVRNKVLFKFHDTEEAVLIKEENSVEFTGRKDAYFDGVDRLYFREFSKVRSMFPGIDVFFREATLDEKIKFLDNDLFDVDEVEANKIGQRDSRRIALVLNDDSIDLANGSNKARILKYAREFSDQGIVVTDDEKIFIKDTKALKKVLNLMTSRYYTSEITGKKMESYGSSTITDDSAD